MLSESEEQRPGAGAPISLSTVTQKGTYLYVGISIVAMFHNPQSPQGCQNDVFFTFTSKIIDVKNMAITKNQKRPHRAVQFRVEHISK